MKTLISLLTLLVLGGFMVSKSGAFEKSVNAKTDTLKVPFTYWFPSGGPFTGLCGNPYSLVFTGTVSKLYSPKGPFPTGRNVGEVFYSPQTGIILINDIKYKTAPTEGYSKKQGHTYDGEGYFISDCFNDLKLKEGDKVIAFVYSYEGEYCIPGNSILKLNNFKDSITLYSESGFALFQQRA